MRTLRNSGASTRLGSSSMPRSILITGARAPVSLHLARILMEAGHRVVLADTHRFPFSRFSSASIAYVQLPSPRTSLELYGHSLTRAMEKYDFDLVIPTCEEVFYLAALRDFHNHFLPLLAPPFEQLKSAHNKFEFAKVAEKITGRSLSTEFLPDASSVQRYVDRGRGIVLKPVWSRFGDRAIIQPTTYQIGALTPTESDPWIAQAFLPGEELCCWALARKGEVVALQAYRSLYRAGQGASLAFEPIEDAAVREFVGSFAAHSNWSGQLSFDFRRDAEGVLYPIECNPRATSGLHFFMPGDGLDRALLDGAPARPSATRPMTMSLAMLAYGLPYAIRQGRVGKWCADYCTMEDITAWKGDRSLIPAQFLSLAEIMLVAVRNRCGLKAAATEDIEWNGKPLDCRSEFHD